MTPIFAILNSRGRYLFPALMLLALGIITPLRAETVATENTTPQLQLVSANTLSASSLEDGLNRTAGAQPDLIVEALAITTMTAERIDYRYTIKNIGTASAGMTNVSVQAFLSNDTIFNNSGDVAAGGRVLGISTLAPGESHSGSFGATPAVDPATMGYLTIMVDWGRVVAETNEANNTTATPIQADDCATSYPAPILNFQGHELYTTAAGTFVRYELAVTNYQAYDDALFAAAPELPACGLNTNAARTWVNLYDNNAQYLYGFCALSEAAHLEGIWFAEPLGTDPPASVSVELNDRKCEKQYRSAEITIPPYTEGKPDLIVESLTVDSYASDRISYSYVIKNVGDSAANLDGPSNNDTDNVSVQAFLSNDPLFNNEGDVAAGGTILGTSPLGMLNPGETWRGTFSASPAVDPATMSYLTIMVDWGDSVAESDESNNTLATQIGSDLGEPDGTPDGFEDDDRCPVAPSVAVNALPDQHTFHTKGDVDWLRFETALNETYRIEVQIPAASLADVALELYSNCSDEADKVDDNELAPGIRVDYTAESAGPIYLRLANVAPNGYGDDATYQVSVRLLQTEPSSETGALILLAGRLRQNDHLQTNIHNVTHEVYTFFRDKLGYDDSHIQYLATDDSLVGYDAFASEQTFKDAIVNWAKDTVGSEKLLTIYMIDHGEQDTFYIDEPNRQRVTPERLNQWLEELEAAVPGLRINVFIEACNSGSFISGLASISSSNRVIVTSTNALNVAYASEKGAHFSDHFISALSQGHHIFGAYWEATESVRRSFGLQQPLIDGDGNGLPNEDADFLVASQRSLLVLSTRVASDLWPPYIENFRELSSLTDSELILRADIIDNSPNIKAWAVVYPPSYVPPASSAELVPETLDKIDLTVGEENRFQGSFDNLVEPGRYRIVIHAEDINGLRARPASLEFVVGEQIFLPLIAK